MKKVFSGQRQFEPRIAKSNDRYRGRSKEASSTWPNKGIHTPFDADVLTTKADSRIIDTHETKKNFRDLSAGMD